jgi:hypothetical protein
MSIGVHVLREVISMSACRGQPRTSRTHRMFRRLEAVADYELHSGRRDGILSVKAE